jgi:hypothetical protein
MPYLQKLFDDTSKSRGVRFIGPADVSEPFALRHEFADSFKQGARRLSLVANNDKRV